MSKKTTFTEAKLSLENFSLKNINVKLRLKN